MAIKIIELLCIEGRIVDGGLKKSSQIRNFVEIDLSVFFSSKTMLNFPNFEIWLYQF
jgi:hypothetical protein